MKNEFEEEVKCMAINAFICVIEECIGVRRQLIEQIKNTVQLYIIPNLVPKQEDVDEWIKGMVEYDYKDNSIDQLAADCVVAVAATLGKQVTMPLINELVTNALTS